MFRIWISLSIFDFALPIFLKLDIRIDIGEECLGIAYGNISTNKYRVMAFDSLEKLIFTLYLWHFFPDFLKICMRVDIGKQCLRIADGYILSNNYRVMALS